MFISMEKMELLSPVGSLGMLKAAVSSGADAVYLGMRKFNAREYATNFNKDYLKEAINICKSNNVKLYVTMNTLVKNSEIKEFLGHMKYAYEEGVDSVIIQDPSFIEVIKQSFPGLGVHMSTQTGILNSSHANLFSSADRINLARELDRASIESIRKHFKKKIEMFVHGALCACISGSCLFSSYMGGRSGNRGKCAQPCRKRYDNLFPLSTKELCLIEKLPELVKMGINSIKIEGRMRTPFYTANTTAVYRQAIDSYYAGKFEVTEEMKKRLEDSFSRGFTEGKFSGDVVFNPKNASGTSKVKEVTYEVTTRHVKLEKREAIPVGLSITEKPSSGKQLIVRVETEMDAAKAYRYADILAVDMFNDDLGNIRRKSRKPIYAVTPRIMLDSDIEMIKDRIKLIRPDGLIVGNIGVLNFGLKLPMILDYNANCFNDLQMNYYQKLGAKPMVSPELSMDELVKFKNKDFVAFVHGKIRLMTLAHDLPERKMRDGKDYFYVDRIFGGVEVVGEKELGLFNKTKVLVAAGINQFYVDAVPGKYFEDIVRTYWGILNGKTMDIAKIQSGSTTAWIERGVM